MARFKKFTGGKRISDYEPLEFELNGNVFKCRPAIQGTVMLEFIKKTSSENGGDAATALYDFLQSSMPEEEYVRLDKLLKNPEVIIEIETIGEVVTWLIEQYSKRPTQQPEPSSNGEPTSGTSSTDEPSFPV